MKKVLVMLAILVAGSTVANAQLNGLLNKAKKAAQEKVEGATKKGKEKTEKAAESTAKKGKEAAKAASLKPSKAAIAADPQASITEPEKGFTKSPAYIAAFYENLDKKIFPFQPYYTEDNRIMYQPDSLYIWKVYLDFNDLLNQHQVDPLHSCIFGNYIKRNDGLSVPTTDAFLNGAMARFLADPYSLKTYGDMVRVRLMFENMRMGFVTFCGSGDDQNSHFLKTPNEELRLMESQYERYYRWMKAYDMCCELIENTVPFNNIGSVCLNRMRTIEEMKKKGDANSLNIALRCWRELQYAMEDAEKSKNNPNDENYRNLKIDYEKYSIVEFNKFANPICLAAGPAVAMPKGVAVAANLQAKANELGKKNWGSKFVKAIFTTNNWQIFKNPKYPYNVMHRSLNVDFITLENGTYFVHHFVLKQMAKSNTTFGDYGIMAQMASPITQKVNYKK